MGNLILSCPLGGGTPSCPGWGIPLTSDCCTPLGLGYTPGKDIGPVEVLQDREGVPLERIWDSRTLWDGDGIAPERAWDQWKYYGMEMGYTSRCEQTENITFPFLPMRVLIKLVRKVCLWTRIMNLVCAVEVLQDGEGVPLERIWDSRTL